MKPQHLIQAFSRTNRIFDKTKRFGTVVTMQTPAQYAKAIDEALLLYSNGGTKDVAAPSWEETRKKFEEAFRQFKKIADTPEKAMEFSSLEELKAFAKAFQQLDRYLGDIQVYDEFSEDVIKQIGFVAEEFDRYTGVYHNAIEKIKELTKIDGPDPINLDIEYELESVQTIEVNYRYLVALIQSHIPVENEAPSFISEEEDKRITAYIEQYKKSNPKIGELLSQIWVELKLNPEQFRDKNAFSMIEERILETVLQLVSEFADKWFVNKEELKAYVLNTPETEIKPANVNVEMGDFKAFQEAGGLGNKLSYRKGLRQAIVDLATKQIKPLLKV